MSNRNQHHPILSPLACATMVSLAIAVNSATVLAQAAPDSAGLEEIIVTAQKSETKLQKTPIAISVLGANDLKNRSVQSLEDLMNGGVPSLRVAPFFSRSSALTIGIRGIVPFDANQPSRDAGVGVYIDGVYLGRSQGLGAALFDVERIEVLKGPQGTLFGRNSTGGAVSIVTRAPSGEFEIRQTIGLRNYGGYSAETHIDLPAFNNISLKFDAIVTKRDGTVNNTMQGESDFNSFDRRGLHIGALWKSADAFSAQFDFDVSRDSTTPYYVQLIEKNPASAALAPLVQVQSTRTDITDIGVPQEDSIGKTGGAMAHLTWKLADAFELRSITSYRSLNQTQLDNAIGAHSGPFRANAAFSRYSLASLRQSQYSQELQIVGTSPSMSYVAGAYYYHEDGDDDAWTPNTLQWDATGAVATRIPTLAAGAATPFPDRASTAIADSLALFGQATWPILSNEMHITAGARYTKDKKSGKLTKVNGTLPVLAGVAAEIPFETSSNRVDPTITLAFDPNENIHLYGKWGTAYRAGGANSRSLTYRAFKPETVATTEVGLKTEFLDHRARFNVAAYNTTYKDIQIDFSAVNLQASNRGTLETVNAPGKGTIKGVEIDASFAPVSGLTLSASYAYTNISLPPAINPFTAVAAGAQPVAAPVYGVYTPDRAWTASIDYVVPLDGAKLRAHLDGNWANGYQSSSSEATLTDKSAVVNGRLALTDINAGRGAKLQVALWSRNLLNEQHTFYVSRGGFATFGAFGMFNEPRTFGIDATVSY